jgi:hypothetical protein
MLWVVFNGIVPRLSVWVAQSMAPVPPLDEVKRMFFIEYGQAQDKFIEDIRDEMRDYMQRVQENPSLAFNPDEEITNTMIDAHQDFSLQLQKRGQEINREQDLKQENQNQLAVNLARYASPSASMTFAVHRLARTGVYSSDRVFKDTVKAYRKSFIDYVEAQIDENPMLLSGGGGMGAFQRDDSAIYPDISAFHKEPLEVSVSSSLLDLSILVLYSLVFFAIGFVAFLRYDVR